MSTKSRAVKAARDEYDLAGVVPVDGLDTVAAGSSLLVVGPSMLGTDRVALSVLEAGLDRGEHAVAVTPDDPASRILDRVDGGPDGGSGTLEVVDCSSSGPGDGEGDPIRHVSSPGNLTDIGVCLTKATQEIGLGAEDGVRVAVLSLSTLLRYTDVDRVFKFVHVATSRFAAAGYLSVATIDASMHDNGTLNSIKAQFDGAIELREADGARQIRVRGLPDVAPDWTPL